MALKHFLGAMVPTAVLLSVIASPSQAASLSFQGRFDSGRGEDSAEIGAFDPASNQLAITNSSDNTIDLVSILNPTAPTLNFTIDLNPFGAGINSVAFGNSILAAALEADPVTDSGSVAFFDNTGSFLTQVTVGSLPDMLTFTSDGLKVLVANEGEPDDGVDPEGSVSIIDLTNGLADAMVKTATFQAFNSQADDLRSQGVRLFPEVGSSLTVAQDLEPEFISISEDGSTAYVALQEANALGVLDVESGEFTDILGLGLKDYSESGLDASDRDDGINIDPEPVSGLYMPDAIATYTANGETYIVTANEGDDRGDADEDERGDAIRLKDLADVTSFGRNGLELDDSFDPALLEDEELGRLTISSIDGDTDGDGDLDQIVAYGGRSFSIFDSKGNRVFDSGDDFEQITAQVIPDLFNGQDNDPEEFDSRSDNKGPEPEGVTIGNYNGRTLAFVGLERVGGIMIYDITDPTAASFVSYAPNLPEDISPEGIVYIDRSDSPTGQPLLITTNEISGTTTVYQVVPEPGTVIGLIGLAVTAGVGLQRKRLQA
ncbi:MAG: choice-of-anchor I family protein [Cyanobacteria bacterium J06607_13]